MKKNARMIDATVVWLLIIALCFGFWALIIPPFIGIFLIYQLHKEIETIKKQQVESEATISKQQAEGEEIIKKYQAESDALARRYNEGRLLELKNGIDQAEVKFKKDVEKLQKTAYLYNAVKSYIENYRSSDFSPEELKKIEKMITEIDVDNLMEPTVEIKLHNTDLKDLRKQYKQISRDIDSTLTAYEKRYTTKGNLAIYRLMVVALRSELQNVLYTMRFGKLEDAETEINEICDKYIKIAADGNQSIAPTITRFVTETRSLFLDAVKVEYEYYLRKERIKEEQKSLREQMRQEAEERRKLEEDKKKIAVEEAKYNTEINKLREQLNSAEETKSQKLIDRIAELEALLVKVEEKKEVITKLQNGKAGYVYIISNLGSFGESVFKIGMTRRTVPQERIDELGSASVPFCFDVHSFIFSEDAPALETAIHNRLNANRVNKVNLRKEFFDISLDDLENLVYELEPTAEFNRTMAAEQYRQSLSISEGFELGVFDSESDDEDEEE